MYLQGFICSFICLALQIFYPKMAQFIYSGISLPFVFSAMILGFATGCAVYSKKREFNYLNLVPIILISSIALSKYFYIPSIFYVCAVLSFIPMGAIVMKGLINKSTHKFYFFELLGGALGVIYGMFSLPYIKIETSISLFAMFSAALLFIFELKSNSVSRLTKAIFACGILISFFQINNDIFNLIKWSENMPYPQVNNDSEMNGYQLIRRGDASLLDSRWSTLDRTDILKLKNGKIRVYANNKAHSDVILADSKWSEYSYLKKGNYHSALILGVGGGNEFNITKDLGVNSTTGVEINKSLVKSLKFVNKSENLKLKFIDQIVIEDAKNFLDHNDDKFDLIFSKYTTHMTVSQRYFANFNLMRTHETVLNTLEHLSDSGLAIWVLSGLGQEFFRVIEASYNILKSKGSSFSIENHFAVFEKTSGSKSVYHLVFSKMPMDTSKLFEQEVTSFRLIYPNSTEQNEFSQIFSELSGSENQTTFSNVLKKSNSYFKLTDDAPIANSNFSRWMIFKNIYLILGSVIVLFLLSLPWPLKMSLNFETGKVLSFYICALVTGFYYGYLQIAVLQEAEYLMSTGTYGFGILLSVFLLGSALGSILSGYINFYSSGLMYIAAPFIYFFWKYFFNASAAEPFSVFEYISLTIYVASVTIFFPKLMSECKQLFPKSMGAIFCLNVLSMGLGTFVYCWIFLTQGKYVSGVWVSQMALVSAIVILLLVNVKSFMEKRN